VARAKAAPAADAADQQWAAEDTAVLEAEAVVAEVEAEEVVVEEAVEEGAVDTRRWSRSTSTRSYNNP